MPSAKHIPLAILSLILISAVTVLIIGFRFAREEKTTTLKQDRKPLSNFSTRLLEELGSLDSLYQKHLLDIRDQIHSGSSNIKISAICRNIVGVEQVSIFREAQNPNYLDLRETDRSSPISLPRQSGDPSVSGGIIVDIAEIKRAKSGVDFQWIRQPGHPPHFAARLDYKTVMVLRINPEITSAEMDAALADWLTDAFAPIEAAGIPATLQNPSGKVIISTEVPITGSDPDLLIPLPSTFGDWKISSWGKKEMTIAYNQPVLIGSATLAVVLVIAGIFGYTQQQRALHLAEQRVSFVNQISHELRTPMTNILLNIDLLSDSLTNENRPQIKRLELISEEANRLSRLLENVLTFSTREKTHPFSEKSRQILRLIPCDVKQIIDSVLFQFAPTLSRKNLTARQSLPDSPVFALVDPDALSQIIGNLISNVEKYAADGGKFEISIKAISSNKTVSLSITDFGPGVPASEAARIFKPFVRLSDATTEGVSGTGLGLAIARDLAESMNGKLVMEPCDQTSHEGCRFILTLPLSVKNVVTMAS